MRIRLLEKLNENKFLKSVTILVSGNVIGKTIGLVSVPILSRLYSPEEFGENGLMVATTAIIVSLGSLGLNSAVMLPKDDKESSVVFKVAFYSASLIYLLIFTLTLAFSRWYKLAETSLPYLVSIIIIFLLTFTKQLDGLLKVYINRKGMNRVLFNNSIISALSTLIISIPLGILNLGVLGIISAAIFSGAICSLQMIYHANPFREKIKFNDFLFVFRKYKDFIRYSYPSIFIGSFAKQFPTRFLSANFGNEKLGDYSMTERIMGIPLNLLAAPISTIYFRTVSQNKEQNQELSRSTFYLIRNIMLIGIIPIFIMTLWGEDLFIFVLGKQWGEAGKMASVLIIQYVFNFSSNSISLCRVVLNRQKLNLIIVSIRFFLTLIVLYCGVYLYNDIFNVVVVYSIGTIIFFIIDMAFNFWALKKYTIKYLKFSIVYATLALLFALSV